MFSFARHLRSRAAAFAHDLAMVPVAWMGAYWLRYNLETIPGPFLERALELLPAVVVVQGVVFWYFGLYRGVWRFASLPDMARIGKAALTGVAAIAVGVFLFTRMQYVPRSVLPLYGGLLLGLLGGPRMIYRWLKDHKLVALAARRVLIVGGGEAAELLLRDLVRHPGHGFRPVALVDDSARRQGREIQGVRVLGTVADLPALVARHGIDLVLIAIPSGTSRQMRRVVETCEAAGVAFRTLPPLGDLVSGSVTVNALREVSIEDLLGREQVPPAWARIEAGVAGRTVMVTGGAGSIGSELCRQIARLGPRRLVVVDHSEHDLYRIGVELEACLAGVEVLCRLGDVADPHGVALLFDRYRPDAVFHAAAYKQVPLLEDHVREAVRNNVLGTRNVAAAALEHDCHTFVLISTDKAVNPGNVMGATKRAAEIVCQRASMTKRTRFVTVRFGNVLGSAGSVVPLFRSQIEAGGPVTVTHPEVNRYFMTITEACQLILQSAVFGEGGETFVLDMGEPVPIRYLAEQMIRLSGRTPGGDIDIEYTGLRPGEKLSEELFHLDESLSATEHAKILKARNRPVDDVRVARVLAEMEAACAGGHEASLVALLGELVPEFRRAVAALPSTVIRLDQRR